MVDANPLLAPRAGDNYLLVPQHGGEASVNYAATAAAGAAADAPAAPTAASWRACGVLSLSVLLCMSTWLSASVALGYLEELFGIDAREAPTLTIAVQAGFVCCAVGQALFQVPDRINCRYLMCGGGLLACGANLAMLACAELWQALLARFATGVAMALVYPPSTKALAAWFASRRGLAMSFLVGAISPGSALPCLVEALPGGNGLWRTRRGFVLLTASTSAVTLVGALMPVCLVGDGPHPFPRAAKFELSNLARLAKNGPAVLTILAYCGHNWELYGAWSWLPTFLAAYLPSHAAHAVAFAAISAGGVAAVALGSRGDRHGRAKFCVLCSCASLACDLAIGLCGAALPPAATAALALAWGFVLVPDSPQYATLITELVDPQLVGTALVVTQALGYVCTMPSIFLMPTLSAVKAVGPRFEFAFLAPGAALSVLAMLRLERTQRRKRGPV